jgi:hypothetical protein
MLEGVRHMRRERTVLGAIALDLFAVLLGGATALMPVYATDILHVGAQGLGALKAAPYVGALASDEVRRAYVGFYCPFVWRGFNDFGTGHFGDWGCHILGLANGALQLSLESLISVEVIKQEGTGPFTYPKKSGVKYEFGPRGNMPPVTVYWEDNVQGDAYLPPGMSPEAAQDSRYRPGSRSLSRRPRRQRRDQPEWRANMRKVRRFRTTAGEAQSIRRAPRRRARSTSCPARGGPSISCRMPTSSVLLARVRATTARRTPATGCAPARAALRRPAPISALPGRTRPG